MELNDVVVHILDPRLTYGDKYAYCLKRVQEIRYNDTIKHMSLVTLDINHQHVPEECYKHAT